MFGLPSSVCLCLFVFYLSFRQLIKNVSGKSDCLLDFVLLSEGVATLSPRNMTVRLVDGPTPREGRVEVWYSGRYGVVCDDLWDITDAAVVCRQLGYSGAEAAVGDAQYGEGRGLPIWLDDVRCSGSETRIEQCAHGGWGVHNCDHSEVAGVKCCE